MFDIADNPDDMIVLAQAQTQDTPALAPAPNWVSDYPGMIKFLVDWIRTNRKFVGEGITAYSENGPLGLPTLTWETSGIELSYIAGESGDLSDLRPEPQGLQLAAKSCLLLDIEAGQAGAWGPDCKIERFIEMPEGRLETPTEGPFYGDSWYTPVRVGMDKVRFILGNGAGRQVDVTVYINVLKWEPEEDEEESDTENNDMDSFLPDNPKMPVISDTQIKSDVRAIGFCSVAGYTASEGEPENGQAGTMFDVGGGARQYFQDYENRIIKFGSVSPEAVQLIKGPDHGKLSYDGPDHWEYAVVYKPDQSYVGNDSVEFLVDVQGTPVRVVYSIKVTKTDIVRDTEGVTELCEGKFQWKISRSVQEGYASSNWYESVHRVIGGPGATRHS